MSRVSHSSLTLVSLTLALPVVMEDAGPLVEDGAARIITRALQSWYDKTVFGSLKHVLSTASRAVAPSLLAQLVPSEASLLSDPVTSPALRFRLAAPSPHAFPPVIVFKIVLRPRGLHAATPVYLSGRSLGLGDSVVASPAPRERQIESLVTDLALEARDPLYRHAQSSLSLRERARVAAYEQALPARLGGRSNAWRILRGSTVEQAPSTLAQLDLLSHLARHASLPGVSVETLVKKAASGHRNQPARVATTRLRVVSHARNPERVALTAAAASLERKRRKRAAKMCALYSRNESCAAQATVAVAEDTVLNALHAEIDATPLFVDYDDDDDADDNGVNNRDPWDEMGTFLMIATRDLRTQIMEEYASVMRTMVYDIMPPTSQQDQDALETALAFDGFHDKDKDEDEDEDEEDVDALLERGHELYRWTTQLEDQQALAGSGVPGASGLPSNTDLDFSSYLSTWASH